MFHFSTPNCISSPVKAAKGIEHKHDFVAQRRELFGYKLVTVP